MEDKDKSLTEHLEELRAVIIRCLIAAGVVLPFAFWASSPALDWFIGRMLAGTGAQLNYFSPVEVFLVQIKATAVIDLAISFPFIAVNIWRFVLPALYEHEAKAARKIAAGSGFLFVLGIAFCITVVLPFIIRFGVSFSTDIIKPVFGISEVVGLGFWLSIAFGIMFQLPIVAIALVRSGIISKEAISSKRPYVIVVLLIAAAVITPPDIISQLMVFIPSYLLFEIGLLFAGKGPAKKKKEDEGEERG